MVTHASLSDSPGLLTEVERGIAHEFAHRIEEFHLFSRAEGVILEGRTRTYFCKQLIQQAVLLALPVPIVANNIRVEAEANPPESMEDSDDA